MQLGSLIEVVNRIGSIFYGSLLGVFVLALTFKRANGHGAFIGLLGRHRVRRGVRVPSRDQGRLVPLAQPDRRHRRRWSSASIVSLLTQPAARRDEGRPWLCVASPAVACWRPRREPRRAGQRSATTSLIAGGTVVDGTGRAGARADVAIKDGRIAAIGRIPRSQARARSSTPPASIVAPGFIDVHTHADDLADSPRAENFVRMGVTTIVAGNCGRSALDVGEALDRHPPGRRRDQFRDARSATTRCGAP